MALKSLWNDKFESLLPETFLGRKVQQHNAPAQNSILSKSWFSENPLEDLKNWPLNSPDMKIFEDVLRHPKINEQLWAFCHDEFEKIPLVYVQNL